MYHLTSLLSSLDRTWRPTTLTTKPPKVTYRTNEQWKWQVFCSVPCRTLHYADRITVTCWRALGPTCTADNGQLREQLLTAFQFRQVKHLFSPWQLAAPRITLSPAPPSNYGHTSRQIHTMTLTSQARHSIKPLKSVSNLTVTSSCR